MLVCVNLSLLDEIHILQFFFTKVYGVREIKMFFKLIISIILINVVVLNVNPVKTGDTF